MSLPVVPTQYVPKYFTIQELVSKSIYEEFLKKGKVYQLYWFLKNTTLYTLDKLREAHGPIIVNNWKGGGQFSQCGLRDIKAVVSGGASWSQHYFGTAMDCHFTKTTAAKVRSTMESMDLFTTSAWRTDPDPKYDPYRYIAVIERSYQGKPCSWFHFDTRNQSADGAIVVLDI